MNIKKLEKGSILSETSFYVVKELQTAVVVVTDEVGNTIKLSNEYVKDIVSSADYFERTEKLNMTQLAELFIGSPRVALTVSFMTKGKEKTAKEYNAEVQEAVEKASNASVKDLPALLTSLITNPIQREVPGKERIMKGRHYGHTEESIKLGRINFIDMEEVRDTSKKYDTRIRQVDPRTINYLIVNKVKYVRA